jgi:radical SAM protein with 4Fe4S-binding SPASM domain
MRSNLPELSQYVELARQLHMGNINVSFLVPYEGLNPHDEALDKHSAHVRQQLLDAAQRARRADIHFGMPPEIDDEKSHAQASRDQQCRFPWNEILINPDGNVYPCCFWYEETSMGDLKELSFHEIWKGNAYRQLRQELTSGNFRPTCRQCPIFGQNAKKGNNIEIRRGV